MPTALITGASIGIGRELALLFARDGYELVLVARDQARLAEVADACHRLSGKPARVLVKDLAQPTAPDEIHDELQRDGARVDALVNNAGFGFAGPFVDFDTAKALSMIQVNITSLVHLTRLFLPAMTKTRSGGILNVASTAAFQAGPYMAVYYATKAFVLSFTEALAEELKHAGVRVTAICPGPTHTEFQQRAGLGHSTMFSSGLLQVLDAATVARIGYEGFKRGQRVVVTGRLNRLHVLSVRFAPRRLVARIAAKVNRSKG